MSYEHNHKSYDNKPEYYHDMATVETVTNGQPYYVASKEYGYKGLHLPVKGTVSTHAWCDSDNGSINYGEGTDGSLWVTCTKSTHQFNNKYQRCSLYDTGVVHQTYNDRLAFLSEKEARDYAETGRTKPFKGKKPMKNTELKTGMIVVEIATNTRRIVIGNTAMGIIRDGGRPISHICMDDVKVYDMPVQPDGSHVGADLTWAINEDRIDHYCKLLHDPCTEEMTMDEVCKALGRNVKIIK